MARKKNVVAFSAVVSGAALKRALEERRAAEMLRNADIATVREFLVMELENAASDAVTAFERLAKWMLRE